MISIYLIGFSLVFIASFIAKSVVNINIYIEPNVIYQNAINPMKQIIILYTLKRGVGRTLITKQIITTNIEGQ